MKALNAVMRKMTAGVVIKTQHVPYKGSAPILTDLLGGHIQMFFSATVTAIPYIKSGRLKGMAITGAERLATLPDVPTFAEGGLPGFTDCGILYGILAPAGTPKPIINKLSVEIAKHLATPDFRETLASQGMAPYSTTPEHYAARMKADITRYTNIIKVANIKFEK